MRGVWNCEMILEDQLGMTSYAFVKQWGDM